VAAVDEQQLRRTVLLILRRLQQQGKGRVASSRPCSK
jgi:hypothetical protein